MSTKVLTGKCRFSFVHLLTPHAVAVGGQEKYSVTLLIPKSDKATIALITGAIEEAKQKGVSEKWGGKMPKVLKDPIWDGDGQRQNGDDFGPECKGCYVVTASSLMQPGIVDRNVQDIIDAAEVYSGMYGRVTINFFPYEFQGNRGIGCGLNNVQKISDGEPLGGFSSPNEDFTAIDDAGEAPGESAKPQTHKRINPITGKPMD